MDFIFALFWLGLILTAASIVFGLGMGIIMFVIGYTLAGIGWLFNKLTGKKD